MSIQEESTVQNNEDTQTKTKRNIIRETIVNEVQQLRNISINLISNMRTAKTKTKKDYFKKKLKKNNERLMQMLVALQSLPSGEVSTDIEKTEVVTEVVHDSVTE